jgi:hypothetical protein
MRILVKIDTANALEFGTHAFFDTGQDSDRNLGTSSSVFVFLQHLIPQIDQKATSPGLLPRSEIKFLDDRRHKAFSAYRIPKPKATSPEKHILPLTLIKTYTGESRQP